MISNIFKKLNYKPVREIIILHPPDSFQPEIKEIMKETKVISSCDKVTGIDFILAFGTRQEEVELFAAAIQEKLRGDAIVWFAYPKGTSKKYKCEFNRDNGWSSLGAIGLEGVRMVAIDQDWSALRFRKLEYIRSMTRSFSISKQGKEKIKKKNQSFPGEDSMKK